MSHPLLEVRVNTPTLDQAIAGVSPLAGGQITDMTRIMDQDLSHIRDPSRKVSGRGAMQQILLVGALR